MSDLKTTSDVCKRTRYISAHHNTYVLYVYDEAEQKRERVRKLNSYIANKWRGEPMCQCSKCSTGAK